MFDISEIKLENLVSLKDWQHFQDLCSDTFGVPINTLGPSGDPIAQQSGSKNICEHIHSFKSYKGRVGDKCIDKEEFNSMQEGVVRFKCPLDLDVYLLPIKTGQKNVIAFLSIGPVVLNKRRDQDFYKEQAEEIGVPVDALLDRLIEINVFSHSRINAVISLVERVFSHIVTSEYDKRRLSKLTHDLIQADPQFKNAYEKNILDSLLKTCTIALDADSGSVMKLNNSSNQLNIASATRLDKDIVDKADVKIGEGISGKVAETSKPVILSGNNEYSGFSENMKRRYIKSSMVVPFSKVDSKSVYGVINLNITRKDREFTDKDILLTKELVNLASIALSAVK